LDVALPINIRIQQGIEFFSKKILNQEGNKNHKKREADFYFRSCESTLIYEKSVNKGGILYGRKY
jgi:hypothetical protein